MNVNVYELGEEPGGATVEVVSDDIYCWADVQAQLPSELAGAPAYVSHIPSREEREARWHEFWTVEV